MNLRNPIRLLMMLLIGWTTTLHANIEVISKFEPSSIALGNTSKYSIEIIDSQTQSSASSGQIRSLPIPPISGLTLRNGQTSSRLQSSIINGHADSKIIHQIVFDAIPKATGTYTIPHYVLDYNGERLQVPAATLTVVERSENAKPMETELIFLTLEAPKKFYVGQSGTATLKLYLESNTRIGDYNFERDTDGFIVDDGDFKEPTESSEIVNNQRYRVLGWPLTITPISTGTKDLNYQCELIAQIPNSVNPYSNSIFDDLFGRNIKRFNVYTKPTQVDVLPLPTKGKPESFSGAVGQFNIEVNTDARSTRLNEPIMLSLKVSGEGNFERIQGPELPKTSGWRSYPPESVFEADTTKTFKGTKRFDYIFVPEKTGKLKLPEVSFSFFDPDVEKYVELTSPAITVEVAPSSVPPAPVSKPLATKSPNNTASPPSLTKSLSSEELLLTLDYSPEKGRTVSPGSTFTRIFYGLNGGFLIAFTVIGSMGYLRKKNRQDKHYRFLKSARQELKAVLRKTDSDDLTVFYGSAQTAVRLATSIRTKQDLRSADLPKLEAHFQQLKLPETIIENARKLFQTADSLRFSGQATAVNLSEARTQLNSILKAL